MSFLDFFRTLGNITATPTTNMTLPMTPLAGMLGFKMPRYRGSYEESGGEKDKETEEDKMARHEKHPHFEWVSIWGIFSIELGIF